MSQELYGVPFPGTFTKKENAKLPNGTSQNHVVTYTGSYFEYLQFVSTVKESSLDEKTPGADLFKKHVFGNSQNYFCGGTYQDLIKPHTDFKPFNEATKQIASGKLFKSVATQFDQTNTRRRKRDQYDGEWDYDRRYDLEPFQKRSAARQVARVVKIKVNTSFNAGVGTDQINKFGGFVGAVINTLEKNNYLAEVWVTQTVSSICEGGAGIHAELRVKRSDEYLPVNKLLKAFSSIWYRRAGFGLIIAAASFQGKRAWESLGSGCHYNKTWEILENQVMIYGSPNPRDQEEILKQLLTKIGEKKV